MLKRVKKEAAEAPAAGTHPEAELLLCCARTCMDSERAERIRALLREDIDWAYLLRIALRHRMMPLLYWNLHATCPEAVPQVLLDQLQDHFHANVRHNLFLTGELLKLLQLFKGAGISALPFKGPVLAASVYGNLSLRQFSDLDILVHKRDVLKAGDLLISQGYKIQLTSAQQVEFLQEWYHFHFVRDGSPVHVEIHWAFTPRYWSFPFDFERLWERLEHVNLAGTTVLNLLPEDLLLILCVHGFKHHWEGLKWICDIAELIRVYQGVDWRQVMEQARTLGSERVLFLGLFLASNLLGAALPEEVLQRVQADTVVKSLTANIRERFFSEANDPLQGVNPHVFFFRMRERLRDRVRYLLYYLRTAMTPNEKDWAFLPLPAFLSFLYYLLPPIRLVRKYGLSPWKLKRLLGF